MKKIVPRFYCRSFTTVIFSLALFFLFSNSFGQVKFSAAANERVIGKNDYLQVQYIVENATNVEGIIPPPFKNFSVVSGPNQQSSMSNINGVIKQSVSISFVLKPLTIGNFVLGAATAKADGKEYHSNTITVQVNNSTSSNNSGGNPLPSPFGNLPLDFSAEPATHQFDDYILRKGENVAEKIKKNLFIKIDVNKTSCFVGEPLVATYKLYTRLKSESNVLKTPSFNGFSVSELEMPDNFSVTTEKYNGRDYNVYTLRKVQLYPLQSGTLSLEPVEVKNTITFLKAEYAGKKNGDIFYNMLRDFADESAPGNAMDRQVITLSCAPLNIIVKPLPEANKTLDFKGAVGNYKVTATLNKSTITTGDAGSLKLIISGAGNLQMVNAPTIIWPAGLEGFESKSSENLDKFSIPIKGDKIFTYPFTISNPGDYIIPPVNFSYFDINLKAYKTISTQPLSIHVTKGKGNSQRLSGANKEGEHIETRNVFYENRWLLIMGVMFLTILSILFLKKKNTVTKKDNNENVHRVIEEHSNTFIAPSNPLADAEEKLTEGDGSNFYKALDISLHKYLSQKLNVTTDQLTKKKINERMDKCNVGVGTTVLLSSLLEDIEINLYAPASSKIKMHEVYEKASEVVSLLDKQIC